MEAHLDQTKLAELIDMKQPQLSKIEKGTTFPLPQTLWKIARACNCKVDDLYEELREDE